MAVYKRGYQRYDGPRTGSLTRLLSFPRMAWQRLLAQRLVTIVLMLAMIWPLLCAGFIYLSNHSELWPGLDRDVMELLEIGPSFFIIFTHVQASFVVIAAALIGPGLIAPDLANGGLPLYLSRPSTRAGYVAARLLVLVALFSLLTWVPGLLLFLLQCSLAGWTWASTNWRIAAGLPIGFGCWILLVSLVALTSSAWVRWRMVAGGAVLGFFFLTAGAAVMVNAIFRDTWGSYLNPAKLIDGLFRALFGLTDDVVTPAGGALVLAAMGIVLCAALLRKLRPVEVVR